jgi:hypothetical protein
LHGGTRAAEKPAHEGGEIEEATAAEVARLGDVARAQCVGVQVGDELAQKIRDYPSSYCEIMRIGMTLRIPVSASVYKGFRLGRCLS